MRRFWKREAKSAAPQTGISDLRAAQWSGMEQRNVAAREIALAFGVPPMLLGIPGDATYANYREANSAFWRLTVSPLVNKAARAISGWLEARVGGAVTPDLEHVLAFQLERAERWARIDAASFLTEEEKRRMARIAHTQPAIESRRLMTVSCA